MTAVWAAAGVCICAVALSASGEKHPLVRLFASGVCGCCALGLVNALSPFSGVRIALNFGTAFVSCVLGVPGIVLLLALRPLL